MDIRRSFPIPRLNTLGPSVLSYAADEQTGKQTDGAEHHTQADRTQTCRFGLVNDNASL